MSPRPRQPRRSAACSAVALALLAAGCSGGGDAEPASGTQEQGQSIEVGSVVYTLPLDWVQDGDTDDGWVRYYGFHPSHPDVAAAEFLTYEEIPHDSELDDADDVLSLRFPKDDDFTLEASGPVDVPGTEEALRTEVTQDFMRPEFDTLHITDYSVRTPSGTVTAFRLSAVGELVEDGTRDDVLASLFSG